MTNAQIVFRRQRLAVRIFQSLFVLALGVAIASWVLADQTFFDAALVASAPLLLLNALVIAAWLNGRHSHEQRRAAKFELAAWGIVKFGLLFIGSCINGVTSLATALLVVCALMMYLAFRNSKYIDRLSKGV